MDASGRRSIPCVALCALALLSGAAQAAPLAFSGSLSISIGGFGIGIPGEGTAQVDTLGHLGSLALGEGSFQTEGLVVTITTSAAAPVGGIVITARNGAGSFARPGGGVMPLLGVAKVCTFGPCSTALANLEVPLSVVGAGGTATFEGAIDVTVIGAPWTSGTAAVGSETAMGFARGPASQTSSTARASGEIQLVTPIRILTNLGTDFAEIAAFGVLTLHFIPEPTTLALLGGGLAATALLGRRKQRA